MNHTRLRLLLAALIIAGAGAGAAVVASASGGNAASSHAAATGKSAVALERAAVPATTEQQVTAAAVVAGNFTAITPYRSWDTRVNLDDKVRHGDAYAVDVLTDTNNNPMIPATATAISFNITVTGTESSFGFVTVFNADAPAIPGTSTINWVQPNFTIANGGIVALGAPGPYVGQIGVALDGAIDAASEIIVDVTGYYTP